MICKFCGNSIEDNSDFCFICGQKVENDGAAVNTQSNDVFSQAAQAPVEAPVAPAAPVAQTIADCPYVTPESPCVNGAIPQPAVAAQPEGKKKGKKSKDPSKASKGLKFFTALFIAVFLALAAFMWGTISLVFVALIIVYALFDKKAYKKAKAAGYEEKAVAILNSTGIGACIGLALVCVKFLMVAYM